MYFMPLADTLESTVICTIKHVSILLRTSGLRDYGSRSPELLTDPSAPWSEDG